MFTTFSSLFRSAAAVCVAAAAVSPMTSAEACHRRGYGYSHGYYAQPVYVQPVYVQHTATPYVTTAPSAVVYAAPLAPQRTVQVSTASLVIQAKTALKAREYAIADKAIFAALQREPKNSDFLQLRALILFGKADFKEAAAMGYSGIALGRAFDAKAVAQLYPSVPEYNQHFATLTSEAAAKPDVAHLQFLMGYHFVMQGRLKEGRAALELAQQKLPTDKLIPTLLAQLPKAEPAPVVAAKEIAAPVTTEEPPLAAPAKAKTEDAEKKTEAVATPVSATEVAPATVADTAPMVK